MNGGLGSPQRERYTQPDLAPGGVFFRRGAEAAETEEQWPAETCESL